MYDSVHLVKNVCNNLVSAKRFIFPQFEFYGMANEIKVTSGDISSALLQKVHEKDEELQANLLKAHKINSKNKTTNKTLNGRWIYFMLLRIIFQMKKVLPNS